MTAQDLKNSILQRAIEGKLVPQRQEEGTAKELLAKIRAEKARLIKEKKIKKSKPLPAITDDEKPFDIPESWEWVRLKDLGQFSSGKTPSKQVPSNWANGTINWFTSKDIKSDYLSKSQILISEKATKELQLYPAGTLLMVVRSGILKRLFPVSLLKAPGTINQDIKAFQIYDERISMYLFICLKGLSPYILKQFRKQVTTVDSLRFEDFSIMPIPMPPLAEQQRILERVEELQPDIDAYDKAQTELTAIEQRFPGAMKKSLLQYAIEGKLVPQRHEEGTAKELLAKIRAEKARLIQEKKIKKTKPLPPITDNETPFDIPDGWEWARVGDIVEIINGDRGKNYPSKSQLHQTGDIPFISAINIQNGTIEKDNLLYVDENQYDALRSGKLSKGDMVLCIRGSLGKNGRYPFERGAIASSLVIIRSFISSEVFCRYFSTYLSTGLFQDEINRYNNGTAQPNLGARDLMKFLFPLPPLAEQHRMVARLEELLPLCDALAAQL
ncbi:MAG: restriction endonuclease subunit S [Selenomonas bovis]